MEHCVGCGHALGQGLFCTQCGRPCDRDDWRTGTAERPVVPPIVEPAPQRLLLPPESLPSVPPPTARRPSLPPPVVAAPPAARYPLYADEAVGLMGPDDTAAASDRSPEPPPAPPQQPSADPTYAADPADPADPTSTAGPSGRRVLPWVLGVVAVLAMALVGTLLLLGRGGDAGNRAEDPAAATSPSATSDPAPTEPRTEEPDRAPADPPRRRRPAQVTRSLTVEVPETAAPNQDVRGNLVRYEATNLIDGVPTTCWRMPGAADGEEIVLRLAEPTRVAQVGLINGYAKTSGDFDWYAGNRRVLAVEWVFDDGTTVAQSLKETRALQTQAIEPVRTTTIRLRLVEVSAPGRGRAARDYTAISDVSVTGTPL